MQDWSVDETHTVHTSFPCRYALKCVRKRDVVEKNMQDALLSELDILKEARSRRAWLLFCMDAQAPPREVDHPFIVKFVRSFRDEHLDCGCTSR